MRQAIGEAILTLGCGLVWLGTRIAGYKLKVFMPTMRATVDHFKERVHTLDREARAHEIRRKK